MNETAASVQVRPIHQEAAILAAKRLDGLIKPLGSLGGLEEMAIRLAGIYGTQRPHIGRKKIIVMAADHGVTAEGVASAPKAFTAIQTRAILKGMTGVGVLARRAGADLTVVDIGVDADLNDPGLVQEKIRYGAGNILQEDAMTRQEALQAIDCGIRMVREAGKEDYTLLGIGEMGIGNTTPTAAIVHALRPEIETAALIGKGAGLTEEALKHKIKVVREAVARRAPDPADPLDVLQKVGGLEIAGMAGCCLGAAEQGLPMVIDGVISMAAAYLAWKIEPGVLAYLFASHCSAEPAYRVMAEEMGMNPPLHLHMRLGEGSGCPLMFRLMEDSCAVLEEMATFEEINTSGEFLVDIRE